MTAKFDRTQVLMASCSLLYRSNPVFHLVPGWHNGEGRHGDEVPCNNHEFPDGLYKEGPSLPETIVTPCGQVAYRRHIMPDERWAGVLTVRPGRMVEQGDMLALGHARKIGRPCRRCFPNGDS